MNLILAETLHRDNRVGFHFVVSDDDSSGYEHLSDTNVICKLQLGNPLEKIYFLIYIFV